MEKMQLQQQWWRAVKSRLSYKNATILICFINFITALFLIHSFLFSSSSNSNSNQVLLYEHIKTSEDIRRSMVPVDLIRRVREIRKEVSFQTEVVQQKDVKQTTAVDLISRLNNYRSSSDSGSFKALEEWRKRKMERARLRSSVKNGTTSS